MKLQSGSVMCTLDYCSKTVNALPLWCWLVFFWWAILAYALRRCISWCVKNIYALVWGWNGSFIVKHTFHIMLLYLVPDEPRLLRNFYGTLINFSCVLGKTFFTNRGDIFGSSLLCCMGISTLINFSRWVHYVYIHQLHLFEHLGYLRGQICSIAHNNQVIV